MKGTEKQIAWAQDIINNAYTTLDRLAWNCENVHSMINYTMEDVKAIRSQLETLFADPRLTAAMIIDARGRFSPTSIESAVIDHHNATK